MGIASQSRWEIYKEKMSVIEMKIARVPIMLQESCKELPGNLKLNMVLNLEFSSSVFHSFLYYIWFKFKKASGGARLVWRHKFALISFKKLRKKFLLIYTCIWHSVWNLFPLYFPIFCIMFHSKLRGCLKVPIPPETFNPLL